MPQGVHPVEMISLCNTAGELRPLRFRMEDSDHQILKIDVCEVISAKKIQYIGIEAVIYLCKAVVQGTPWMFELKYTVRSHSWCFFRRVY